MSGHRFLHPVIARTAAVHFIVDGYSNIYAPLLPLLITHLDMSLAMAGTLAMCFQIAASVSQLGFGYIADRWQARRLLIVGPFLAVLVLSQIGFAGSPLALALILIVGGLGCAAFHPPAAALAHRLGGSRRGLAMSIHITGGTLGFSLGPLLFAPVAERWGLAATPLFVIPGLLVLTLLLRNVPPLPIEHPANPGSSRSLRPYAGPLALLYAVVVLRTLAALSFATFVPVMLTRRGLGVGEAGAVTAVYLLASGLGGFLGGPIADRFGPRIVIAASLLLATPFLAVAPLLSGWQFTVMLAIGGFFLQSTLPVNVTYGQTLAPVSAATVSSLMMGFGWGTGGLSVPLVGYVADRIGLESTLGILAFAPVFAAACVWPLPPDRRPPSASPSVDTGIVGNV